MQSKHLRRVRYPTHGILLVFAILSLVALGCRLSVGGPKAPETPEPVTTEAVEQMEENLSEALQSAQQTKTFTYSITENQLNSYLSFQLEEMQDPPLTDPQVVIKNGQIEIYGTVQSGALSGQVMIVVSASVDDQGQPDVNLLSAKIGPLPVPASLLERYADTIDSLVKQNIRRISSDARLTAIEFGDGVLTIKAEVQ